MVRTDWIQPAWDSSMAHLIIVIYPLVPQKFENFLNSCQATIRFLRTAPYSNMTLTKLTPQTYHH